MVIKFTSNVISPPVMLYMGVDKVENEDLIKYGWPEDVWFHVDKVSSAHVYLRLPDGMRIDSLPEDLITDCAQLVKANSIDGNKMNNVGVVYTMWSNLKKTGDMAVGQIGFHNQKQVKRVVVEKRINEIVNRLNKTERKETIDYKAERDERDAKERQAQRKVDKERRDREAKEQEAKEKERKARNYEDVDWEGDQATATTGGQDGNLSDDFMAGIFRMRKRDALSSKVTKFAKTIGKAVNRRRERRSMDWLRDRVFGRAEDGAQRLLETGSSSSSSSLTTGPVAKRGRGRSMMGAKQSSQAENQAFRVSPMPGEVGFAASTSAIPQRQDRQIFRHVHNVCVSSAHPQLLNGGLDDKVRPYKLDILLNSPPPDKETQELHAWNPDDRSVNIFVKEDDVFTFHRHPVAQSTDCIRGKMGYTHGFHVWQMTWPQRQRGTHAVVGVSNKIANLHAQGYTSLIGTTTESYGWDLTRGECYHDSGSCNPWTYPYETASGESGLQYNVPDQFYCILDMDEGYLAFATDDEFLGVAFRNLKGQTLYPIVAAVWGHCEITMKYLGGLDPAPLSLMEICRRSIRQQLGGDRLCRVPELPIPPTLRHYLLHKY